jgi:hypothetical protein
VGVEGLPAAPGGGRRVGLALERVQQLGQLVRGAGGQPVTLAESGERFP